MARLAIVACLLVVACKGDKPSGSHPPDPGNQPCAKAERKGPVSWIEDDYGAALACARAKKVPLVLDMWAPWCHTCLSMQTTVFMDSAMAAYADKFVFAGLDTDREVNADVVGKFAPSAWPTFYVISNDEAVLARFIGAASVAQFREFLDSGARAAAGGGAAADARFLGGQRALAKKDFQTADTEFSAALGTAPESWSHRAEALHAAILAKSKLGDTKGCLDLAEKYLDSAGASALGTNFVQFGLECANKHSDAARVAAFRSRGIARLQAILADKSAPLSVDDRAEAFGYLRDALDTVGKKAEAKQVAEQTRTLLDDAMTKAPTPLAKMTHLWLRAEVYAYLQRPLDLVHDYEQLARELPKEYEPRARLGWLYLQGGKYAEAAKWTDEALALVYGPRKGRVLAQRAEIAKATGDAAAERKYREDAVKLWESLPAGQRSQDNLDKAKQALAGVGSAAGSAR